MAGKTVILLGWLRMTRRLYCRQFAASYRDYF